MKRIIGAFLVCCAIWGCKPPKPPTAAEVLNNVVSLYRRHSSVTYRVKYSIKLYNRSEPIDYSADCKLIRDDADPLFNGSTYLSFPNHGGTATYYSQNKFYIIEDSVKKITEFADAKNQRSFILGITQNGVMNICFLRPDELTDMVKDSTLKDSLTTTKIGYGDYWKVMVKFPDNTDVSDRWDAFWVNKKDTTMKKIAFHLNFHGQLEYRELNLDSITFDKTSPEEIKNLLKNKFSSYTTNVVPAAQEGGTN